MKNCKDCNTDKPESEYYLRKTPKGSVTLMSFCKTCMVRRTVAWQMKNRERYKKYHQEYYLKNKGKV